MQLKIIFTFLIILNFTNLINTEKDIKQIYCGIEICDSQGGVCNIEGRCKCLEGYTTLKSLDDHLRCNYKQTSAFIAGMIEIITGLGLGHLYAGRRSAGLFKLFCIMLFCTCLISVLINIKKIREETEAVDHPYVTILAFSSALFKIVIVIWQIIDGFLFFLKIYKDGNGIFLS